MNIDREKEKKMLIESIENVDSWDFNILSEELIQEHYKKWKDRNNGSK